MIVCKERARNTNLYGNRGAERKKKKNNLRRENNLGAYQKKAVSGIVRICQTLLLIWRSKMTFQEFKAIADQYCRRPVCTQQDDCWEFQDNSPGYAGRYTPGQGWELMFNGYRGEGATIALADEALHEAYEEYYAR
jgi:hypothetical protein